MKNLLAILALIGLSSRAFAAEPAPANGYGSLILIVVFIAIMYFLMIRPQMKRSKEHRQLLSSLGKGDEVVTNGGIVGKIAKVGDNFIEVTVAENVDIKVQKQAVSTVLPKGTVKNA